MLSVMRVRAVRCGTSQRWKGTALASSSPEKKTIRDITNEEIENIPAERIRNFSIIAHIDHGKSTLADCLLQWTGNINAEERAGKPQMMDTLQVERERGITVKAQTATMIYHDSRIDTGNEEDSRFMVNMIDTPGHVDFSYEVSRSLACCEGALLLVDSTQSIQAQTLDTYGKAQALGLKIIPVVTKIDLPNADPVGAAIAMSATFGVDPDRVICTSAKKGEGIEEVLRAIVDDMPPPSYTTMLDAMYPPEKATDPATASVGEGVGVGTKSAAQPFLARIVDSWFDRHRGVVCLVQALQGRLAENQRLTAYAAVIAFEDAKTGDKPTAADGSSQGMSGGLSAAATAADSADPRNGWSVQDVGLLTPDPMRMGTLRAGQLGYVIAGMRSTRQARIGDTMYVPTQWPGSKGVGRPPRALLGYEPAKCMLFASVFPVDTDDLDNLFAAVDRLCLNDSSLLVTKERSTSLGAGLRCGFLGFLHMEVTIQRLRDEFELPVVMTTPSVPYIIVDKKTKEERRIESVAEWPDTERTAKFDVLEPIVTVTLITPERYLGDMLSIVKARRGVDIETSFSTEHDHVVLYASVPWQEVVSDMSDAVKHNSSGYATFNYTEAGFAPASLQKIDIMVNGKDCDPLSFVHHTDGAAEQGRKLAKRLKDVLKRQQFEIIIQARMGHKILARERIPPYRKDVLMKSGKLVGGGDESRKKKLLEKQKAGKKRAKMVGNVEIDQKAFWSVLQR